MENKKLHNEVKGCIYSSYMFRFSKSTSIDEPKFSTLTSVDCIDCIEVAGNGGWPSHLPTLGERTEMKFNWEAERHFSDVKSKGLN